ncbi:MAG: hypothetical protein COA86_02680 [Kangiella sp.]|nr:MAG: hypothetical protein COA86_02680 [Kangiella sp.]
MLKERYEIEVLVKTKMIIEVDPEKFNDSTVAGLLKLTPQFRTQEAHLKNVALMHCGGRGAGSFGVYGLVRVDGDAGGKLMPSLFDDSGLNILPIDDNFCAPNVSINKITPVARSNYVLQRN